MKRRFFLYVIISLVPSLLYFWCLSPGISWEDSGEFITTAATLGIAHPPGHPLYIILAHLFTIGRSSLAVARAVNLFSAISAFIALFAFSVLLSNLFPASFKNKSPLLAFLSLFFLTSFFAFSETFWYVAEIAEVYSLHALLSICLFAALLLFYRRGGRYLLLFSYVLGVSLTNNITLAYLIPAFLCFLIFERKKIEKRFVLPSLLLFLLGVSLYSYVLIRAHFNPVFNWGNASTMKNFIHLISAQEFSRGFMSLRYTEKDLFPTLLHLLKEVSFWGIAPLVFGAFMLFRKKRTVALLFITAIFSNITLSLLTGRGPDLHAYFLPSIILFFLLIGYGVSSILDRLQEKAWTLSPLLFVLCLIPILLNFSHNCGKDDKDARNYGIALLEWIPEGAILLTENTNDYFILTYLREIERVKEIDIFYAPLFREQWYRESLISSGFRWGEPLTPLSFARGCEKQVFYTPGAGISLPIDNLVPNGPLFHIAKNEEPEKKDVFTLPRPVREQGKRRYAYLYARFGEFYFAKKEYSSAISAFERAKEYDPANAAIYHNLALLYRKMDDPEKAERYEMEARRLGFTK